MGSNTNGATRSFSGRTARSVGKNGASRRVFTLVSALAVAISLVVLSTGASAASKCYSISTGSFTDSTHDGHGASAPDITGVTVTSYEGGDTAFQVAFAGRPEFSVDMLARIFVDSDKNSSTGSGKGFEYMIQVQRIASGIGDYTQWGGLNARLRSVHSTARSKCENQPKTTLFKWSGSRWVRQRTDSLSSRYGDGNLTVQTNASKLGNALAFNFAVYAASNVTFDGNGNPSLSSASYDWAPNEGTYKYQPFQNSTYTDSAGDGSGAHAPDITNVVVTKWGSGLIKFWIAIPGTEEFGQDMLLRTYVDSDSNSSTGDSHGYDYMIQAQRVSYDYAVGGDSLNPVLRGVFGLLRVKCNQPSVRLFRWSESGWTPVETNSLNWSYDHGLTITLSAAAIGNASTFNFAVYAASEVTYDENGNAVLVNASYDLAPNTGSYSFPSDGSSGSKGSESHGSSGSNRTPSHGSPGQFLGVYEVRYHVFRSKNFGDMKRGRNVTRIWKLTPSCTKGNCKVTKIVVAGSRDRFRLIRKGKTVYKASAGKRFDCAASYSAPGTESIRLKVKKSGWVGGKWRVTRWVGTLLVVSPGNNVPQCGGSASYAASLTGKLKLKK